MANPYFRCGLCGGNMWPPGQMDHTHGDPTLMVLKLKYRRGKRGWSKAANVRTNSAKPKTRTLRPRRRVYGPF